MPQQGVPTEPMVQPPILGGRPKDMIVNVKPSTLSAALAALASQDTMSPSCTAAAASFTERWRQSLSGNAIVQPALSVSPIWVRLQHRPTYQHPVMRTLRYKYPNPTKKKEG
eukprot:scaffold11454_cov99-Isochrysis_galbana.AAC.1